MATIENVLKKTTVDEIIKDLKSHRYLPEPKIEEIADQLNPLKHDVMDDTKRKNKWVKVDTSAPGFKPGDPTEVLENVERIALSIQKLIRNRAVSFVFGNPVTLDATPADENEDKVLKAVNRVLYDIKQKSFNRRVARELFSCTEVAEVWYPVKKETNVYGFDSKFKLRCGIFSPLQGDKLYPYFDETGDMIAFSREYSVKTGEKTEIYFETYTDSEKITWKKDGVSYIEEGREKNELGKIPVVFGKQNESEWEDVQNLIDRLEKLLSNFADTNDYHASPKIVVKGELRGFAKKGEAGGILEVDEGGDAKYLSWANAPESVKLEIETLLRMIYTITQTPDISFDAVKGIGGISGVALELLFMDAHLKVQDHCEVLDEYLQRRVNIIKAYIGGFNKQLKDAADNILIEPVITPYIIKDKAAELKMWTDANGGNPIMSQKASFQKAALTSDTEQDFDQYQTEQASKNAFSFNEPTNV